MEACASSDDDDDDDDDDDEEEEEDDHDEEEEEEEDPQYDSTVYPRNTHGSSISIRIYHMPGAHPRDVR